MKKSELRKIIREELESFSGYTTEGLPYSPSRSNYDMAERDTRRKVMKMLDVEFKKQIYKGIQDLDHTPYSEAKLNQVIEDLTVMIMKGRTPTDREIKSYVEEVIYEM